MSRLVGERGTPGRLRSDNGPEFIAAQVTNGLRSLVVEAMYIAPGAPWQNGYAESFNSRHRDEFLEMNHFSTMTEAKELARPWKEQYNHKRLHGSLGYQTPGRIRAALWGLRLLLATLGYARRPAARGPGNNPVTPKLS